MGGVINGKATFLAIPAYPSNARQLGITGSVSIRVLIDEDGKVISAKGFCGNPIFFAATEDAARQSKFSPTTLSGTAVKVSGTITYNFFR
ncbi:MAG: energy transducer TonB [Pyrinomonadaceae bacterium]